MEKKLKRVSGQKQNQRERLIYKTNQVLYMSGNDHIKYKLAGGYQKNILF